MADMNDFDIRVDVRPTSKLSNFHLTDGTCVIFTNSQAFQKGRGSRSMEQLRFTESAETSISKMNDSEFRVCERNIK